MPEPEETEGTGSETDSGILATGSNAAAKAGDRFLARHQTPTVRTRRTRAARVTGVTKATDCNGWRSLRTRRLLRIPTGPRGMEREAV